MGAISGEQTILKPGSAKASGNDNLKARVKVSNLGDLFGLKGLEDPIRVIQITREGLPKKAIRVLAEALDMKSVDMAGILPISSRTIQRYQDKRGDELLTSEVSDHLVQVSKVLVKATEVFEDAELARGWLKELIPALGGRTPLSLMDTSTGIELVMTELVRIEYGVFS